MARVYKMKGQKRKKKEEKYDKEEEPEQLVANDTPQPSKKVKTDSSESEKEVKLKTVVDDMPGIPIVPVDIGINKPGVIFVLEKASLEIEKVGKTYQLLSSEEHGNFLKKSKRNPANYLPDIAFQAIQTILDSLVNKSGRLKALYVKTQEVELLLKLHINAADNRGNLVRLIKNPVTQYLPINSCKIGFSHSSEKLLDMYNYVGTINNELDLVFVVGAMSHGKIDEDYVEDYISISEYPMSAAYCISKITTAVERKLKML